MANDLSAVYEEIRRLAAQDPRLLRPSTPVSADSIDRAQAALGVEFPPSLRRHLLEYGSVNVGSDPILGLFQPPHFSGPRDDLVYRTQMMRQFEIPSHLVVLLDDDEGDAIYYLDCSQRDEAGECPVLLWEIEEPEVYSRYADSFPEFLLKRMQFIAAGLE